MILTAHSQDGVAQGKGCFGDVAPHIVRVLGGEAVFSFESLTREQQSGATVHEQASGFRQRDVFGDEVMRTAIEQAVGPQ